MLMDKKKYDYYWISAVSIHSYTLKIGKVIFLNALHELFKNKQRNNNKTNIVCT